MGSKPFNMDGQTVLPGKGTLLSACGAEAYGVSPSLVFPPADFFHLLLEISRKRNYYFWQIEFRSQDEYKEDKCNAPAGKCAD